MKTGKPNTLLIELVIVLLFFSLSVAVILQLFVATHSRQLRNEIEYEATLLAEDVVARFMTGETEADAFFAADGWTKAADGYRCTAMVSQREIELTLVGTTEETAAGALHDFLLTVTWDGERLLALPLARYTAGEGSL